MSAKLENITPIPIAYKDTHYVLVPYYNSTEDHLFFLVYTENEDGARHVAPAFANWGNPELQRMAIDKALEYAKEYNIATWIDGMIRITQIAFQDFRNAVRSYLRYPSSQTRKWIVNERYREAVSSLVVSRLIEDPEAFCQRIWDEECEKAGEVGVNRAIRKW